MQESDFEEEVKHSRPFELSAYCWLLSFLFLAWVIMFAVKTPYLDVDEYIFFGVKVALSVMIPTAVASITWLLFGRSNNAASILFCVTFLGLALHGYVSINNRAEAAEEKAALAALPAPASGMDIFAARASGTPLGENSHWVSPPNPRPDTDDETLMSNIEKATKEHLSSVLVIANEYFTVMDGFEHAEIINGKRYISVSQLDRQKKTTEIFLAATATMRKKMADVSDNYEERLELLGLEENIVENLMESYRTGVDEKFSILKKLNLADEDLGSAAMEILDLLQKDWGKWKYVTLARKTEFENSESQKSYDELASVVKDVAAERQSLRAKLSE